MYKSIYLSIYVSIYLGNWHVKMLIWMCSVLFPHVESLIDTWKYPVYFVYYIIFFLCQKTSKEETVGSVTMLFFTFKNLSCTLWESVIVKMLWFWPTSALFLLNPSHQRPNLLLAALSRWTGEPSVVSHAAPPPVSWTRWRMVTEPSKTNTPHLTHQRAPLVALDERWYQPVHCRLVSSFVLIQWQISPGWSSGGRLCLLLVFASSLSWHDAIDIVRIDWAIIATLKTAGVRGVGVGGACVHAVLQRREKSFRIDGAQQHLLHRGGTRALARIAQEYQKAKGVYWEHDGIDPCFSLTSTACSLVWAAAVGNLLVHLSIDLDQSM